MSSIEEIDIIEDFNKVYIKFIKTFQKLCSEKKYKGLKKLNKIMIDVTFDKYLKLIKEEVQFAITEFGPLIFKHREKISEEDDKFFLNKNYNIFLLDMSNKYDFDYQYSLDLVNLSKEVYLTASNNIKKQAIENTQKLMILYSKFHLIQIEKQEKLT